MGWLIIDQKLETKKGNIDIYFNIVDMETCMSSFDKRQIELLDSVYTDNITLLDIETIVTELYYRNHYFKRAIALRHFDQAYCTSYKVHVY